LKVHLDTKNLDKIVSPVITVGTFDGMHLGHQAILSKLNNLAKEIKGESVLLTFNPHPRKVLFDDDNIMLITSIKEKIKLLETFGLDHLIIYPFTKEFSKINPVYFVRDLLVNTFNVKTLVIGYDHHFGKNREGDFKLLEELSSVYNYNLVKIPAQEIKNVNISSTKIRKALIKGDINKVNSYLGHNFTINGVVVSGNKIGRTIDFPTANVRVIDKDKLIPASGVYAVRIYIGNYIHKGMMNIGYNPTIDINNTSIKIEVHIFNFNEQLYDTEINIEVISNLRKEKKYSDLSQLKKQLLIDKESALQILA